MNKFGRFYRLTIKDPADTIITDLRSGAQTTANTAPTETIIEFPITAAFSIKRDTGASLSDMNIQLYNLNRDTRAKIYQDRFSYFSQGQGKTSYRAIKLEAGYGDNLYTVFQGNMYEAGSVRRGTDIITHINARDGGYDTQLTQTFTTLKKGITKKELLIALAADFPYLQVGAVNDDGIRFDRPVSVSGNTYQSLINYFGNEIFIDLEKIYALKDFEVVEGQEFTVDASTGLLETPNRMDSGLSLTTLFEPAVTMASKVNLVSSVQPEYNGVYRVNAIKHDCVMSGAIGGECRTTLGLLLDGNFFGKKFESIAPATTRNQS